MLCLPNIILLCTQLKGSRVAHTEAQFLFSNILCHPTVHPPEQHTTFFGTGRLCQRQKAKITSVKKELMDFQAQQHFLNSVPMEEGKCLKVLLGN